MLDFPLTKDDWTDARWQFDRDRWRHVENGHTVIPYAYHWSVPPAETDEMDRRIGRLNNDLTCVEFRRVDDAVNNEYDSGPGLQNGTEVEFLL